MRDSVEAGRIVVYGSEANVALVIDPDGEGVPVGDQDPLADVEFLFVED